MPATTPRRGFPYPLDTDPIDVAGDIQELAEFADNETVARFETKAALDAWGAPNGALAWAKVGNPANPLQGLYFERHSGAWYPTGLMLYNTLGGDWYIPADAAWWGIPWGYSHIDVGNQYPAAVGSYRWRVPYNGLVDVVGAATLAVTSVDGSAWALGDWQGSLAVYLRAADTTVLAQHVISNFFGRMAIMRLYGSVVVSVLAGWTVEVAAYATAPGQPKRLAGGDTGVGFSVSYLGAYTEVLESGLLLAPGPGLLAEEPPLPLPGQGDMVVHYESAES